MASIHKKMNFYIFREIIFKTSEFFRKKYKIQKMFYMISLTKVQMEMFLILYFKTYSILPPKVKLKNIQFSNFQL